MDSNVFFTNDVGHNYMYNTLSKQIHIVPFYLQYLIQKKQIKNLIPAIVYEDDYSYYKSKLEFLNDNGMLEDFIGNYQAITPEIINRNMSKINSIILEVTEQCNLSCNYCIYSGFCDTLNCHFAFYLNSIRSIRIKLQIRRVKDP